MKALVVVGLLVTVLPLSAAGADGPDAVLVKAVGGALTRPFSPKLAVDVDQAGDYTKVDSTPSSGTWIGPQYTSTVGPEPGQHFAHMKWAVGFSTSNSAVAAATGGLANKWPAEKIERVSVAHWTNGEVAGDISGIGVLTRNPAPESAQFEGALAFRLCRDVFAVADFQALDPPSDNAGRYGRYIVSTGYGASEWNRMIVEATFDDVVSLDGYLPPGRIVVRARRHLVSGTAFDCAAHPLIRSAVLVGRHRIHTNADGKFRLAIRKPGRYRVTVSVAGQTKSTSVLVR